MNKKEYDEAIENVCYRLPLKLINSYTWAVLIAPAKAILPVMGVYRNPESGRSWPGRELISEGSGYSDLHFVDKGINDLINHLLIIKKKKGRHNVYYLTSLALREGRESFFPIYKKAMILSRKWASLTKSERSLYPVFGNKANINDPEVLGSGYHAIGNIYEINQYIKWAGICLKSFYNAYDSLNHKGLIDSSEGGGGCYRYGIYVPE